MNTPAQSPTPRRHTNSPQCSAFAIPMALATTLLVSGLAIALFSRASLSRTAAFSSSNMVKVDQLARGALDIVTADLLEEIRHPTKSTVIGTAPNQTFLPLTPASDLMPETLDLSSGDGPDLTNGSRPNLLKITHNATALWSAGTRNAASGIDTTAPSLRGRAIQATEWAENGLHLNGSATDTAVAPQWVMITRDNGPQAAPGTSTEKLTANYVIGRYAAQVYDVSGLIDLNIAGHATTTPVQDQVRLVGSLASIDLTRHENEEGNSAFGATTPVNAFLGTFRHAGTPPLVGDPTATPPTLGLMDEYGPKTGFLHPISGDNHLLSRKDLLRLPDTPLLAGNNLASGQHLYTHFSRTLNRPVFRYPTTGNAIRNTVNPDIHDLRMANGGAAPDGFTWEAGDPVLIRRFPLSRLGLVAYDGLPGSTEDDVTRYFGLYRTQNYGPWVYVGSDGASAAQDHIMTLAEVAAIGREPNFFELLKAAIHQDSLGVTSGFETTSAGSRTGWTPDADAIDGLVDLQVFRIGANMIDQADADSYPTTIMYDPNGDTTQAMYAYGIEDLPYINAIGFRSYPDYRDSFAPGNLVTGSGNTRTQQMQIYPVLWNPHRASASPPSTTTTPATVDCFFTGRTRYFLRGTNNSFDNDKENDTHHYGASDSNSRFNEMGQGGFVLPVANRNTGSITIARAGFGNFREPSAIRASDSATTTGNYTVFPHMNNPIMGLILGNAIIAEPRPPRANIDMYSQTVNGNIVERAWDGYWQWDRTYTTSTPPASIPDFVKQPRDKHAFLNPGSGDVGFNAIMRFQDHTGRMQPYNAFAGSVVHPQGHVNTFYDRFGLHGRTPASTVTDGIWMWIGDIDRLTPGLATVANPNEWQNAGSPWTLDTHYGYNSIRNIGAPESYTANEFFAMKADPRTARYGIAGNFNGRGNLEVSVREATINGGFGHDSQTGINDVDASTNRLSTDGGGNPGRFFPGMLASNAPDGSGTQVFDYPSGSTNGRGIARPGDDFYNRMAGGDITNTTSLYFVPSARPIVLNRPFRNVGELGFVFRDMPMKSLDLNSPDSVDAGLIDYFCVEGAPDSSVLAGRLNINSAHASTLEALLHGASRRPDDNTVVISNSHADTIIGNLESKLTTPVESFSEIVPHLASTTASTSASSSYPAIKGLREAPLRSLSAASNTRTWNLMVDLVAQSGRYTSASSSASDFLVEGERRYWMHLAIDRFTGTVVDRQIEIAQP